jgi:DNA-binding CsgD family transcriptional regulator
MDLPVDVTSDLVERDRDLLALGRVLDAAAAGAGSITTVSGPAGIGKSVLVDAALAGASGSGLTVLIARASELEHDFAFGVVRQLLERAAGASAARGALLSGAARHGAGALGFDDHAGPADGDLHSAIHGLYWVTANLSTESPLVLVIDDLQWADAPSLRWLAYLVRRLDSSPIAVVATVRTERDGTPADLPATDADVRAEVIDTLLRHTPALRLTPAPLSVAALTAILRRQLGQAPDAAFARACREQTGGVALLVSELVGELLTAGIAPTAQQLPVIAALAPDRVAASVRRRLAGLPADAQALARAVAILGAETELPVAAALAGLDESAAAHAAAALVATQILADSTAVRFRHPILRSAVAAGIAGPELVARHAHAAQLLAARGETSGRVAVHLLAAGGGRGDATAVGHLRRAARAARSQRAPQHAVTLLRRAVAEPPPPDVRPLVLRELGEAGIAALDDRAAADLREARELTTAPRERAELAVLIGQAEYSARQHTAGVELVLEAIEEVQGIPELREEWLRLEAQLASTGRYALETQNRTHGRIQALAATLDGTTPAERLVCSLAERDAPSTTAAELVRGTKRSLEVMPLLRPTEVIGPAAMFLHAGRPGEAAALTARLTAQTREDGSPFGHAVAAMTRGMIALDAGDLRAADAELADAFAVCEDVGETRLPGSCAGWRAQIFGALGAGDEGDAILHAHGMDGHVPELMVLNPLLYARGMFNLEQRRLDAAIRDLRELGRRHDHWSMRRPSPPWRSSLALTLVAAGEHAEARVLAAEELELAREWDTPKAVASALRALALATGGDTIANSLSEATALLEGTPWRLDRARTRGDLGSALRRAGERRAARAVLAQALDEAQICGAEVLVVQIEAELRASGARPRRRAISGLDALTPSERRVAELAADDLTNREIAQQLFVSTATVETHLTRAYRKLDVDGRGGLAAVLDGPAD